MNVSSEFTPDDAEKEPGDPPPVKSDSESSLSDAKQDQDSSLPTDELGLDETSIGNRNLLYSPSDFNIDFLTQRAVERNCSEAAQLLFNAREVTQASIIEMTDPLLQKNDLDWQGQSFRLGNLVHIPRTKGGILLVMSDIEGRFDKLEEMFRKEKIIERLLRGEPVYFSHLGDMIDRQPQGSSVVELLTAVQTIGTSYGLAPEIVEHLFNHIILLAGNHELGPQIQRSDKKTRWFPFGGYRSTKILWSARRSRLPLFVSNV